jgi:two-component system sensor histidine kinase PilS (NtrC family)
MLSVGSTLGRLSRRSIYQEIRVQRASHKNTFLSILNNRILSQSLDGFIAIDHKGLVHASNPRCSQWLGIPRLAGFSLNSNERTLALKNHLAAGNINQRLRLPADPHHEEMTLQIHSLGETKIENTRLSIYTLHDISQDEHQQREEKLASLGRFTAGISHQIKNPIAAITQATELLSDPSTPSSQMPQLTALIKRNANRINNLVGHILSSFRLRPATDYVALESLMSSAITIFKSSHASDHHVLSVNPTPLCLVKFESTSFTEILCNLLDNAVSHCSHKDFSVRVEFLIRRGWVSILFRDDGAGVPMPSRDKIFEPFYTTRAQGIGLGLFVARELAHAQGALLFYKEDHTGHYFVLDIRTA